MITDEKVLDGAIAALGPDSPQDDILGMRSMLQVLVREYRERLQHVDEAMILWMKANGDMIVGEDIRHWCGDKKTTTCDDKQRAYEAGVVAAEGDVDRVNDCLVSQPFKSAAMKRLLGDVKFAEHFTMTTEPELREGKPTGRNKQIILTDNEFTRARRAATQRQEPAA